MGARIETNAGKGRVMDVNILKRLVSIDVGDGKIVKTAIEKEVEVKKDV